MTRGITQEQSEQLKKDLSESFDVPEDEVIDHVAKKLAVEIKINQEAAKNHFSELNKIIENQDLDDSEKIDAIEDIQDTSDDSALLVFAAVAKELVIAGDKGAEALLALKEDFQNLFENDARNSEDTAKAILNNLAAIRNKVDDQELLDVLGEAFENYFDSENAIEDSLESEISKEDAWEIQSEISKDGREDGREDEVKMPASKKPKDKSLNEVIQDSQEAEEIDEEEVIQQDEEEKDQQEESEKVKNQKQQDEIAEEEEKKKEKQSDGAKDSSSEKPKEKKGLWQSLKDGSKSLKDGTKDALTNKIPRAAGAIILGDFAALSIGGALGGPVGLAVVFLFWQFTKDSKEKDKTADKVHDVNAEVDKYKAEREEIRKDYRASTNAGKAASEVETEAVNKMKEQKDELNSVKKTISGVGLTDEARKEAEKVVSNLRGLGVGGAEGGENKVSIAGGKSSGQGR
jgi:outer membrane murein-binding lipoprotein Lpp